MMSRRAMARLFWVVFALTGALYIVIVAWSLPIVMAEAGGAIPFDLRLSGYDLDDARAFLMALSEGGRAFYLGTQHLLDAAYPPLLAAMTTLGAHLLYRRGVARVLTLIAVLGMAADLLENQIVAALLRGDAAQPDAAIVARANLATLTKTVATTIALSALLVGAARALWKRRQT